MRAASRINFKRSSTEYCLEPFSSNFKTILTGLRFVLLVGLCTKRRPWSNSLLTANLVAPCFCFDRELCSSLFQVISSNFKTILTGSSFCTFGGVMYKKKTLVEFVHKRKSCCSLFLLWSRIMFQPFPSDFKQFQDDFDGVFVLYFW